MGGLKRKSISIAPAEANDKSKKSKVERSGSKSSKRDFAVPTRPKKENANPEENEESDLDEQEDGFHDFESDAEDNDSSESSGNEKQKHKKNEKNNKPMKSAGDKPSTLANINASSSREAHAKQKALAKERKLAKPNANLIERAKKIWEKLRLKSHVNKEERQKLLDELFEIIKGRVHELVFKHDATRVIQCAIKYSVAEQRKMIANELKGNFKTLAESRYAKFLIAKLLEKGDKETQNMIISEFYGHVRQLINHPEASWILDDTYRAIATPQQKARLLREWYGAEFSIRELQKHEAVTVDMSAILEKSPEKRKPIMDSVEAMINQIIQKKMNGFTMLHDAMLQYFLACKPGSSEADNFLEHFKPEAAVKEGEETDNVDLLKNLAFTKSGSRLVSLAIARGGAKDRKLYIRPYKDTIEVMVYDPHAHKVLLAFLAVTDDTRLTSKSIYGELLPTGEELPEKVLALANDVRARTVLLYPFASDAKWLLKESDTLERLEEFYTIRSTTSKKEPKTRLLELARVIEPQLLDCVVTRSEDFASTVYGLQFMTEVLLGAPEVEPAKRREALTAVAELASGILDAATSKPTEEDGEDAKARRDMSSHGMKMLKNLVQGGHYDPESKKVVPVEPPLGFADILWEKVQDDILDWAIGPGSFVVLALVETEGFKARDDVLKALKKGKKALEKAAGPAPANETGKRGKDGKKDNKKDKDNKGRAGNAGARILLGKL